MPLKHALVCAPLVPGYDRESGSQRLWDHIEFLQAAGYAVTFLARHGGQNDRYTEALQFRGVEMHIGQKVNVEAVIGEGDFDLALLAFWEVAEWIMGPLRRLSPRTHIIVDSVDLHFLRHARQIFQQRGAEETSALGSEYAADLIRELNTYMAADAVLTVSTKEAQLIVDFTGDRTLAFSVPDCEALERSSVPFSQRNGILFVGNFQHTPNTDAVTYLCNMILPQLDSEVTAEHPTYIVGNALGKGWWTYSNVLSQVRLVGWVPSIRPYMERSRITVLPLLYGAGTKRKMLQTLMVGTPAVSTSVGTEGLDLVDTEHVLVADDAAGFARAMTRLLSDEVLWNRLARQGRDHIVGRHSREVARQGFQTVLDALPQRLPKPRDRAAALKLHRHGFNHSYDQMTYRIQDLVRDALPASATVAVISKGDEELLDLGRRAWHFPRAVNGQYAGHYPADSEEAIAHLETLRKLGADYLLIPATSLWWLDHYPDFGRHLGRHYRVSAEDEGIGAIFAIAERVEHEEAPALAALTATTPQLEQTTDANQAVSGPVITEPLPLVQVGSASDLQFAPGHWSRVDATLPDLDQDPIMSRLTASATARVLVVGTYLATRQNHMSHIVRTLEASEHIDITQRWVAFGGDPADARVAAVTVDVLEKKPKFGVINDLLEAEALTHYDYVLMMDDDVRLPRRFADHYFALQRRLDFALAQPARTLGSHMDLPLAEQQLGVVARQTLLVEIGPIVSFHRSIYDLVFPFDLTSSMGWGYECLWAHQLAHRGAKMGIIDLVPVDHTLRPQATSYSWNAADAGRTSMLWQRPHYSLDKCFRVLDIISFDQAESWMQ